MYIRTGIVQNFQPGVFLFLRLGRFGSLNLGVVHDLHVQVAQLRIELVQVLRRQAVRQDVVDVVVGDVAVLLGQVEQSLDGFGQIYSLAELAGRGSHVAVGIGLFGLGSGTSLGRGGGGCRGG